MKCLKCQRKFVPKSKFNRICPKCTGAAENVSACEEKQVDNTANTHHRVVRKDLRAI